MTPAFQVMPSNIVSRRPSILDVDYVVFYDKPLSSSSAAETYLAYSPRYLRLSMLCQCGQGKAVSEGNLKLTKLDPAHVRSCFNEHRFTRRLGVL